MTVGATGVVVTAAAGAPAGGAPTLVLVNSLATTTAMWDGVVPLLSQVFDVVRYDQRDRGGPAAHRPFTLDDLVDDLFGVLDGLDVDRAHVAGVSLGGLVGLAAAHRRPDRVQSLTAMCCAARFSRETWVERARLVRADGIAPLVPAVLDRWFTRDFQERRPDVLQSYREMLASTDAAGYAYAADVLASADLVGLLPALEVPTLVLSGESDTANPVADQELIVRAVRGARHEVVAGAAHLAPVAQPEAVARLVTAHAAPPA